MKNIDIKIWGLTLLFGIGSSLGISQETAIPTVVISGEPLSKALVDQWISDYSHNTGHKVVFNAKAKNSDLSIEFDGNGDSVVGADRFSVAKVAIVAVAKTNSAIAGALEKKGLDEKRLKALFFDDFLSSTEKDDFSRIPYQVYSRLGNSGVPTIFAHAFGYETSNIKGNAIGGNDFHVLNAMKNDTQAISFNALNVLFDVDTRKPLAGLTILPVDLDGNHKVSDDESFYHDLDTVIQNLQDIDPKKINNMPIAQLQIVVDLKEANPETLHFLNWVLKNGQKYLAQYGFLQPDIKTLEKERSAIDHLVINQ